jgi:hypothetical protein
MGPGPSDPLDERQILTGWLTHRQGDFEGDAADVTARNGPVPRIQPEAQCCSEGQRKAEENRAGVDPLIRFGAEGDV